jgi:Mycothiol maleylpyruvate isomerase N-terminal domain
MTHTAAASRSDDVFVSSFDPAQYLDVLDSEGLLLLRAAQAGDLGAQIPNCPGWTVRDLVAHVGWVYRWAAIIVGDERADPRAGRSGPPSKSSIPRTTPA